MVDSISPAYYATGESPDTFTLTGENFDSIPKNAIGLRSSRNDEPLAHLNDTEPIQIYDLSIDGNAIVANLRESHQARVPVYFSAIVSADRSIVYWVNDTEPLPE